MAGKGTQDPGLHTMQVLSYPKYEPSKNLIRQSYGHKSAMSQDVFPQLDLGSTRFMTILRVNRIWRISGVSITTFLRYVTVLMSQGIWGYDLTPESFKRPAWPRNLPLFCDLPNCAVASKGLPIRISHLDQPFRVPDLISQYVDQSISYSRSPSGVSAYFLNRNRELNSTSETESSPSSKLKGHVQPSRQLLMSVNLAAYPIAQSHKPLPIDMTARPKSQLS